MSVLSYYLVLHGILDELVVYQPFVTKLQTLREYHRDLVIAKFLFGLDCCLLTWVQGKSLSVIMSLF